MNMAALLLKEIKFDFDPQSGRLTVGDGVKRACDSRRGRILTASDPPSVSELRAGARARVEALREDVFVRLAKNAPD